MSCPDEEWNELKFHLPLCTIDLSLWRELSHLKVTQWKLETPLAPIIGKYVAYHIPMTFRSSKAVSEKKEIGKTGSNELLGWRMLLTQTALTEHKSLVKKNVTEKNKVSSEQLSLMTLNIKGTLLNTNTIEDFKHIQRQTLINGLMEPVVQTIIDAHRHFTNAFSLNINTPLTPKVLFSCLQNFLPIPELLLCINSTVNVITLTMRFFLLCFADIKSNLFYYNIALPALRPAFTSYRYLLIENNENELDCLAAQGKNFTLLHNDVTEIKKKNRTIFHFLTYEEENFVRSVLLNPRNEKDAVETQNGLCSNIKLITMEFGGCVGCCAIIRRTFQNEKKKDLSFDNNLKDNNIDNYSPTTCFDLFLDAPADSPLLNVTYRYSQNFCLIPLWVLIVCYKYFPSHIPLCQRKHLFDWGRTEAIIVTIDSPIVSANTTSSSTKSQTFFSEEKSFLVNGILGWSCRTLLFVLGYLGFSGGVIPLYVCRDITPIQPNSLCVFSDQQKDLCEDTKTILATETILSSGNEKLILEQAKGTQNSKDEFAFSASQSFTHKNKTNSLEAQSRKKDDDCNKSCLMLVEMPSAEDFEFICLEKNQNLKSASKKSNHDDSSALNNGNQADTNFGNKSETFSLLKTQRSCVVMNWLKWKTLEKTSESATVVVDMRKHLNPVTIQQNSVDLNIKLIQWRMLSRFDPSLLQQLKFCLVGMGTLGCSVAQNLIGWGVKCFTLIDHGYVTFASPVRQTLYTHEDAMAYKGRGRLKVFAAQKRLLQIRPDLIINAVPLEIPMPGHGTYSLLNITVPYNTRKSSIIENFDQFQQKQKPEELSENILKKAIKKENVELYEENLAQRALNDTVKILEQLIDAHDIIFLLTDSRESRWLPSLIISTRSFRNSSLTNSIPPPSHLVRPPVSETIAKHKENSDFKHPGFLSLDTQPYDSIKKTFSAEKQNCSSTNETNFVLNSNADSENHSSLFTFYPYEEEDDLQNENFFNQLRTSWDYIFSKKPKFPRPLAITVALGFDSFVIIRHGEKSQKNISQIPEPSDTTNMPSFPVLSCYFCNDLEAPTDSQSHRSLDQQCTVTRPGLSSIASGLAVELAAALSQHPLVPNPPHSGTDFGPGSHTESCLGAVPHSIRGFLGSFQITTLQSDSFQHCICCSEAVCKAYCTNRLEFLNQVMHRSDALEEISGLKQVKQRYENSTVIAFSDLEEIDN